MFAFPSTQSRVPNVRLDENSDFAMDFHGE
jgi:hypothetical protein